MKQRFTEQTMQTVLNAIPFSKDCAKHQTELARQLDMSPSALKKIIRELRLEHAELLSSTCGYWRSSDVSEQKAFCTMMRRQGSTRFKSSKRANDTVRNFAAGQLTLNIEGK